MTAALSKRQLAFVTRHSGFPWQRQTDDGAGGHCGLDIRFAPDTGDDWIVVFDDIAAPFQTRVPLNRRIVFVTEPPEFKRYPPSFINQSASSSRRTPYVATEAVGCRATRRSDGTMA